MTRLGWTIAILILLVAAGIAVLIARGGPAGALPAAAPAPAPSAAPVEQAQSSGLLIPVEGVRPDQLTDTFNDARGGGARTHEALDIMAPANTPVLAASAGTVEKLFDSKLGGHTIYIRSPDGKWMHYYAHLAGYAPGLTEGMHVIRGQVIGFVGDTGDAGLGNYHLHYAINRMAPGEGWWQGTPINPYPLLAGTAARRQ